MAQPLKPFSQPPFDPVLGQQTTEWMNWVTAQLNQLAGQGDIPSGQGFESLSQNTIDPTSNTIKSAGSRMSSVTTAIAFTFTSTSASFFWDGTNGSQPLRIGRDDGTVLGPTSIGSPFTVTGLTTNKYYFYPYWDEDQKQVVFPTNSAAVGSPAVAYLNPNFEAAQEQIMRGHIPLGVLLVSVGVTLTGSPGSGSGGSGGGGAGGGLNRGELQA